MSEEVNKTDSAETQKENVVKADSIDILSEYNKIINQKKVLEVAEDLLIEEGLQSRDPQQIVKAMEAMEIKKNKVENNRKTTMVDPLVFNEEFGYKKSATKMSYNMLMKMAKSPIVSAIIKTRKNQVASFSEPQENRHDSGFVVEKKNYNGNHKSKKDTITKEDEENIRYITEFILNCGKDSCWARDDFDTFLRKAVEDTLTFDQWNFEIVRNKAGELIEFIAVDAMTCRIADSYEDDEYEGDREQIGGYFPSFLQIINEQTYAEFYPWELCFAVRNPSTRLHSNNYGRSELEDMVQIVTSQLWADEYNRNFFKQGAAPKGILKVKGGINNPRINDFKQQWRAMISGVYNAFKTPIVDSDEIEFVDLQKSSRDMEFGKWQEYLIRLCCALYSISPEEIGFSTASGMGGGNSSSYEGSQSNEAKLKFSKDKGLKPLLKFIERQINKMIVSQMDNRYVFKFVGLEVETEAEFRNKWKDEVQNIKTIDEVRADLNLPPLPEGKGEFILNPTFTSKLQQEAMLEQQEKMFAGGGDEGEEVEEEEEGSEEGGADYYEEEIDEVKAMNNPFFEDFNKMINLLNE